MRKREVLVGNHEYLHDDEPTQNFLISFDEHDVEFLDEALRDFCRDCTAAPGLAHVRNKIAARVGVRLITTGE